MSAPTAVVRSSDAVCGRIPACTPTADLSRAYRLGCEHANRPGRILPLCRVCSASFSTRVFLHTSHILMIV